MQHHLGTHPQHTHANPEPVLKQFLRDSPRSNSSIPSWRRSENQIALRDSHPRTPRKIRGNRALAFQHRGWTCTWPSRINSFGFIEFLLLWVCKAPGCPITWFSGSGASSVATAFIIPVGSERGYRTAIAWA